MGFDKQFHNESGFTEGNTSNEIGQNVVIDEGVYQQGSHCVPQMKQDFSDLENIIMEGDIILKVHADGEIEDISQQANFQVLTGECAKHAHLFMHHDEMLVKVGDTFLSNRDFVKYANDNAKRWSFFYKCTEALKPDTVNEEYTYCCVYLRNRDYAKKSGSKKRYNCKTDCPCKVKLVRRPGGDLTVTYVCNHHDHTLSPEDFDKLQHNKKLPPYIKEIIMDLLTLEVEIPKIRKFVEMETGVKMSRSFFYDIERKMKLKNEERQITDKRLKMLSEKMSVLAEAYKTDVEDNSDDQLKPVDDNQKIKRVKLSRTGGTGSKYTEDAESAKNLEASMLSDAHSSWMSDSVPGNNRNSTEWDETTMNAVPDESNMRTDNESESFFVDHEILESDYNDEFAADDSAEDTAQETTNTERENPTETVLSQYETLVLQDEFGNIINCDNDEQIVIIQPDENGMVQGENGTIGYFDGQQIIYMSDADQQNDQSSQQNDSNESNACDAAVQTSSNAKPGHSYVPMFDVYMKNGNVTGFVVNDKAVDEEDKSGEKSPQESQHHEPNTSQQSEGMHVPLCDITSTKATHEFVLGDTYTKHEYIHRYNIDNYMANPKFPKYIDTLAKKTRTDVMQMLARVYNEKAMFKMTTTQKGKEGNTKIWYLTDVRRKGKYKMSDEEKMKRNKIGQYMTDILILKERLKSLKKDNDELSSRNKYLEEVALRLAKMQERN